MVKKGRLFVISGPSGVGKNTVINEFLKKHSEVKLSVSCTTRTPRVGEKDGINYFFISKEEFENNINAGKFLEWAKFNDNFYGTQQSYVEKKLSEGRDLILEIDTVGALQVKNKISDAILIFILPPSVEILEQRLRGRGTESNEVIEKRLRIAHDELAKSELFDYSVINDTIENAVLQLENFTQRRKQEL